MAGAVNIPGLAERSVSAGDSSRPAIPTASKSKAFESIVVYPTQDLLKPPFVLFRGGPDWPMFWLQRHARHCRFSPAVPLDLPPKRTAAPIARVEREGVWCGPVAQHFGHVVVSFGSRIALSSRVFPNLPLVFSIQPNETPPAFFWRVLAHFGVPRDRVLLVSEPTLFQSLTVVPQAERLFGKEPAAEYLDLLDALPIATPRPYHSRLYVSRAGAWKGKIAGEAYIETAMGRLGYTPFRPEMIDLEQQLAAYRHASHLVFAEGSALHALQLLGRIPAKVTVIARRRRSRLARTALLPRLESLAYVDVVDRLIHGVGRHGWPQRSAGLSILDEARLLPLMEGQGIPLASVWDWSAFLAQQAHDLGVWIEARRNHPPHPSDRRAVDRALEAARIRLPA